MSGQIVWSYWVDAMSSTQAVELSETERRNIEQACAALSFDYCEFVDAKEFQRLRGVFAEAVVFGPPNAPGELVRGADATIASLASIPPTLVTQHLAFNIRVRVESADSAAGSCRLLIYLADANEPETPEGRKAAAKQLIGIYHDRYVRTASGWRIAERRGKTLLHT
ncbi:MAG: nuclear transport factor 2 family protein [Candidatus Acidiferrales bacterium]